MQCVCLACLPQILETFSLRWLDRIWTAAQWMEYRLQFSPPPPRDTSVEPCFLTPRIGVTTSVLVKEMTSAATWSSVYLAVLIFVKYNLNNHKWYKCHPLEIIGPDINKSDIFHLMCVCVRQTAMTDGTLFECIIFRFIHYENLRTGRFAHGGNSSGAWITNIVAGYQGFI